MLHTSSRMGTPKTSTPFQVSVLKQPEVGKLIHELRQLTELTQVQLAEVFGVAYGTINRWENGQAIPLNIKANSDVH